VRVKEQGDEQIIGCFDLEGDETLPFDHLAKEHADLERVHPPPRAAKHDALCDLV
jgi:hypothetical protein